MGLNLAFFKKISTLFKKIGGRAKKTDGAAAGPSDRKIGIFGHTRSGKTVFLTMLWHQTQLRRDFSLVTDDRQTIQDMNDYYNKDLSTGRWPPPTPHNRLYRFTAIIDSKIRYPFEARDYRGESVAVDNEIEAGEELREYFASCDCLFVLVDAEDIIDEDQETIVRRRDRMRDFQLMLAQLMPDSGVLNRLMIPIAVVVTKADLLDGFRDEEQVELIGDEINYGGHKTYESFVTAILDQEHVSSHLPWRQQVDRVLESIRPLVDYCLPKKPDMQIFFISSTGGVEAAINEDGEQEMRPPKDLRPVGIERPFVWSVNLLRWKHKTAIASRVRRWVVGLSFACIALVTIFNYWHDGQIKKIDDLYSDTNGGKANERVEFVEKYQQSLFTNLFDDIFRFQAGLIVRFDKIHALAKEMELSVGAFDQERFNTARNNMRDHCESHNSNSKEYEDCNQLLKRRENDWDHEVEKQYEFDWLLMNNKYQDLRTHIEEDLVLVTNRTKWEKMISERTAMDKEQLRENDLAKLIDEAQGLSGNELSALEEFGQLLMTYTENYHTDKGNKNDWGIKFGIIEAVKLHLDDAQINKDDRQKLREIASELKKLDPVDGVQFGNHVANHLERLTRDVAKADSDSALGSLRDEMNRNSFDFRFSADFIKDVKKFKKDFPNSKQTKSVNAFLQEVKDIEKFGLTVVVQVSEIPIGYHLRVWDHSRGRYAGTEVYKGQPGSLTWKPGNPIKIGIEQDNANREGNEILDDWITSDPWALFTIHDDGGMHAFKGNRQVVISFVDLQNKVPSF